MIYELFAIYTDHDKYGILAKPIVLIEKNVRKQLVIEKKYSK